MPKLPWATKTADCSRVGMPMNVGPMAMVWGDGWDEEDDFVFVFGAPCEFRNRNCSELNRRLDELGYWDQNKLRAAVIKAGGRVK